MQIAVQFTISESTIIILTKANNDLINGVDLERLKIYNVGYLILKTPYIACVHTCNCFPLVADLDFEIFKYP